MDLLSKKWNTGSYPLYREAEERVVERSNDRVSQPADIGAIARDRRLTLPNNVGDWSTPSSPAAERG